MPDVVANVQLIQTNLLTVADDYLPTALRTNLWGAKSHRARAEPRACSQLRGREKRNKYRPRIDIGFPRNEIQRGFRDQFTPREAAARRGAARRGPLGPGRDVEVINAAYKADRKIRDRSGENGRERRSRGRGGVLKRGVAPTWKSITGLKGSGQ